MARVSWTSEAGFWKQLFHKCRGLSTRVFFLEATASSLDWRGSFQLVWRAGCIVVMNWSPEV